MSKCFVSFMTLDCGRLIKTVIVLLRLLYRWIPMVNPKLQGKNHPLSHSNGVDFGGYLPQNEYDNKGYCIHFECDFQYGWDFFICKNYPPIIWNSGKYWYLRSVFSDKSTDICEYIYSYSQNFVRNQITNNDIHSLYTLLGLNKF